MEFKLVNEAFNRKAAIKKMAECFNAIINKYYPDMTLQYPNPYFKIKTKAGKMGWYQPTTNTISVTPDVSFDDELLKSTVWHEAIHWVDWQLNPHQYQHYSENQKRWIFNKKKFKKDDEGHGAFFWSQLKRINKLENKELITKTGNLRILGKKTARPYDLYIFDNDKNNKIYTTWSPNPKNREILTLKMQSFINSKGGGDLYIVNTDNARFKIGKALTVKVKKWGMYPFKVDRPEYKILKNYIENEKGNKNENNKKIEEPLPETN